MAESRGTSHSSGSVASFREHIAERERAVSRLQAPAARHNPLGFGGMSLDDASAVGPDGRPLSLRLGAEGTPSEAKVSSTVGSAAPVAVVSVSFRKRDRDLMRGQPTSGLLTDLARQLVEAEAALQVAERLVQARPVNRTARPPVGPSGFRRTRGTSTSTTHAVPRPGGTLAAGAIRARPVPAEYLRNPLAARAFLDRPPGSYRESAESQDESEEGGGMSEEDSDREREDRLVRRRQ